LGAVSADRQLAVTAPQPFARVLARLALIGSIAAIPLAPAQAQLYKPPSRGAPGGRIGGASRSAAVSAAQLPVVVLLAPADHAGLTARPDPTLYYLLSRPTLWPMRFTIAAPGQPQPVLDVAIPAPATAGISPLSLARYRVRLEPGIDYTWSVSVVLDSHAWSHNIVASAGIVFDPAQATAALAATPSPNAADFAAAGLWYDAVAAAADARQANQRALLAALLRQEGLQSVVTDAPSADTQ
jgi:hypothetical protein